MWIIYLTRLAQQKFYLENNLSSEGSLETSNVFIPFDPLFHEQETGQVIGPLEYSNIHHEFDMPV